MSDIGEPRPISVSSDGEIGGPAVLVECFDQQSISNADGGSQFDDDEDMMLNALLGSDCETKTEDAAGRPLSDFVQAWDRDVQAYLSRLVCNTVRAHPCLLTRVVSELNVTSCTSVRQTLLRPRLRRHSNGPYMYQACQEYLP